MIPITDHALQLDDVPEEARPHFDKELEQMSYAWKIIKRFHLWLREETELNPGTRTDYVRAAIAIFIHDEDPQDVANADAAIKAMRKMTDSSLNAGDRDSA